MRGGMMDGGGMAIFALFWLIVGLVFLALMIAALVWLIRNLQAGGRDSEARRELDRRYAAGQIDRDDYLERRRDLEQRP